MSAPHDRSSGKEIVPSWLQNHSFSGNLSALFAQLAESSSATTDIHSISIDKDTDVVGVPVRASAMDYFDSSEDEYEDNDDFVSTNNPYPPSSSLVESHNVKEISDRNMDEYVWVEKTDTSSKLSGKKRKRKYNDDKKSRKKRKINDKSDDNYVNKKEAKRKLKEKEKILELEERVRKEYGAMKRASTYQWGSIIKDASSGEYMTVKENPLKTDNELYYWDTKPDKDLLLYERIYSNLVPSYYHAPKRCLGLKKNEIARFLKQHQTYLITSINNLSNSSLRYYSRPIKRTGTISIKPQKNNSNNYMEENDFISLDLDNNSVNNTEIEEESFEDYIMKKTHLFNEETQKNPNNIDIWLSFISFQDEIYNSRGISISKKAIIEKKMAIYLSALQKNPDSEKLLIGYLQCCNELWDMEKLLSLWENVMSAKKNSPTMWEHYISFRLTHFTSFSVSEIRKLFNRALKEMYILQKISINRGDLESSIKAETSIVEFFRRLCLFEAQSGYMERAVALYQAIIEFNCEYPSNVEEFDSRLKVFEAFWDSEAPRIGEESSKGWSIWCNTMDNNKEEMIYCTKNTKYEEDVQTLLNKLNNLDNMEDDEYSFSKKLMEENLFHPFWRPKRSGDHENSLDMEQVILFTDIEDYIYPIRILGLKIQLIQNFIEFLLSSYGGNLSILLHLSDDIRSNLYFESDTLGYDLCEYLPQHEDVVANQLAPSTTIEQEYNSILPKEYSLFDCNTSNEDSLLSDDIALFIKRVLEQSLNWFPNNSELSQLYLKFELYYHRTESRHTIKQRSSAMKNTCKMLLSKRSEDLELWKSYAKAEQVLGRYEEAKRILDTALSMSKLQNTSISLVKEYAKLELYYPTINHSKITLARVLSILMSLTESKFESIIVKRKELSKLSIDENFNDLNSLSKTILPRITPVRVLQCQSVSIFFFETKKKNHTNNLFRNYNP